MHTYKIPNAMATWTKILKYNAAYDVCTENKMKKIKRGEKSNERKKKRNEVPRKYIDYFIHVKQRTTCNRVNFVRMEENMHTLKSWSTLRCTKHTHTLMPRSMNSLIGQTKFMRQNVM